MKRKGVLLLALTAAILSGCRGDNSQIVSENNNITVTVAVRSGEKESWETATRKFFIENPEIRLKFIELGSEFEQYRLLTSALSSGNCAFDAMEIEDALVKEFVDKSYLKPLQTAPPDAENYIKTANEAFSDGGQWYAVPFQADIGMALTRNSYSGDIDFRAFAPETEGGEYSYTSQNLSDETDVMGVLMEMVAYTGDAAQGLQLYKSIYKDNIQGKTNVKLFREGKLPLLRVWSSELKKYRSLKNGGSFEFLVSNLPKNAAGKEISTAKVFGMAISSLTAKDEQCEKFLEYCASREFQAEWVRDTGIYPIDKRLYDDAAINSEWNHILPMKGRIENLQIRPSVKNYINKADKLQSDMEEYLADDAYLGRALQSYEDICGK